MEINNIEQLQKPNLFEKFKEQVFKDFELTGLINDVPKINNNQLEHIFQSILNSITSIENRDTTALKNLLYRIDLSEQQIREAINKTPNRSYQEVITELIIKRILQKVILKQNYSSSCQ